jgi:hypothetical protein
MFVDADVLATRIVQVILFIVIFVLTRWLINKLAALVSGLFGGSVLGTLNRVFGALLSGVIMAVLIVFIYGVALTTIGEMGFDIAFAGQDFLERSRFVLPLIYAIPRMFGIGI